LDRGRARRRAGAILTAHRVAVHQSAVVNGTQAGAVLRPVPAFSPGLVTSCAAFGSSWTRVGWAEMAMAGLFDGFEGYRVLADADVDHALTSAVVAVDTNVLLNLYRYNVQTTEDLLAIFEKLGDRLVIPHQAGAGVSPQPTGRDRQSRWRCAGRSGRASEEPALDHRRAVTVGKAGGAGRPCS
jgi:PIN like domain